MDKGPSYWLSRLERLKIDRAKGDPAPHKPFLLLVILEMADRGEIVGNELSLSADLAFRFGLFNEIIADRNRPPLDLRLPFHHLQTSGIWIPLMADGKPSPHRKLTERVRFDPAFLICLHDPSFRDRAKRLLIETPPYFRPEEQQALLALFGLERLRGDTIKEPNAFYSVPAERGREARFRMQVVVVAYRHTCALTGYRLTTLGMESIVDAAHIHEFCDSRNNDPRNGLALSKNAHWQFDRGLWTISDDFRVIVNREKFSESGVFGQRLADLHGKQLFLPADAKHWPKQEYLEWHRAHKFNA